MSETQEKWVKWEPVEIPDIELSYHNLKKRYFADDYSFTNDGKDKIILNNGVYQVEVLFEGYTDAVRITDDGHRLKYGGSADQEYGHFLFKIENSRFAQWLAEESCGVFKASEFMHFCIGDTDLFIDILARFEPTVTVTKLENKEKNNEDMVQISKSEFEELRALKAEADEKERQKRLKEENDPFAAVRDWEGWD